MKLRHSPPTVSTRI